MFPLSKSMTHLPHPLVFIPFYRLDILQDDDEPGLVRPDLPVLLPLDVLGAPALALTLLHKVTTCTLV